MKEAVTIFTDGASRGNPGPGGWGSIVVSGDSVQELGGREGETTNNRMELSAAIEALHYAVKHFGSKEDSIKALVHTDSSYVLKGATVWIRQWQSSDWKTKSKSPVLNRDLWEVLSELLSQMSVSWKLLPGHSGIPANERCDEIATEYADGKKPKLYSGPLADYAVSLNITSQKTKAKSKSSRSAKAHSYVSEIAGAVMVHKTWAECEARVKGKAARFKKVFSPEEEQVLISLWKKAS